MPTVDGQQATQLIDRYFNKEDISDEGVPPPHAAIPPGVQAAIKVRPVPLGPPVCHDAAPHSPCWLLCADVVQKDMQTLLLDPRLLLVLRSVMGRAQRGGGEGGSLGDELKRYRGRVATRVFHGIGSQTLPTLQWRENPFWEKYKQWKFGDVEALLTGDA
jgi:hypothetical protein